MNKYTYIKLGCVFSDSAKLFFSFFFFFFLKEHLPNQNFSGWGGGGGGLKQFKLNFKCPDESISCPHGQNREIFIYQKEKSWNQIKWEICW